MTSLKANPRYWSYQALFESNKRHIYVKDYLNQVFEKYNLSQADQSLAKQLACGVIQRKRSLDHYLKNYICPQKTPEKFKVLLYIGVYQLEFLERVPNFAAVSETVHLAKTLLGNKAAAFVNAVLRKYLKNPFVSSSNNIIDALSDENSMTSYFVKELIENLGLNKTQQILKALNTNPELFALNLKSKNIPFDYISLKNANIAPLVATNHIYIQNPTPGKLISYLYDAQFQPSSILDMCASPGGKLILAHQLFPQISLTANDISLKKIKLIETNLKRLEIKANFTCFQGEQYPLTNTFDLIIIDAPCSNSGVLHKKAEARWRIESNIIKQLQQTQYNLLKQAEKLLSEKGQIWYMTCSILPSENETIIQKICEETNLQICKTGITIYPDDNGYDGGFACSFSKTSTF